MERISPKVLTPKQAGFVKDYVDTGNIMESVKKNYATTSDKSAANIGTHLIKNEDIQAEIKLALRNNGIDPNWIISQHKELALSSENDMVKTKNLEDLGEMAGLYPKAGKTALDVNKDGIRIEWGGDE